MASLFVIPSRPPPNLLLLVCAIFLVRFAGSPATAQAPPTAPTADDSLKQIYAGFLGDWVGHLEYRDFSDDSRVLLPTWLRISQTGDGRSMQFAYVYDDGRAKTVREISEVSIDAAAMAPTMSFTSDRDHSSDRYALEGLPEFSAKGGMLHLSGSGVENDKKVDVRITITLRRNLYSFLKETRLPGQDLKFRDAYAFTRQQPQ